MKILVDVDGVVVDLVAPILDKLNEKFGTNIEHEDIRTWDFFSHKSTYELLSPEQKKYVQELMCEPGMASNVELIPGVKEALETLVKHGCEIVFLTAPWKDSKSWIDDRTKHLNETLGHISKEIIFSWNKEEVDGDLLIDDNPAFLRLWLHKNNKPWKKGHQVLLFKQPWNEDTNIDGFSYMDGWKDAILGNTVALRILR